MKNVFIVLFFFINSLASAKTSYVSPTGKNTNTGTFSQPWLTWSYAFSHAFAGDTVFFRGGNYSNSGGAEGESGFNIGTPDKWIYFLNYPGEEPILDCSNKTVGTNSYFRAITVWYVGYLHFKGLSITNVNQLNYSSGYTYTSGLDVYKSNHIIFENIKVSKVEGPGIGLYGCDEVYVKNCDVWDVCDYHATSPGQNGVGFQMNNTVANFGASSYNTRIYFEGCRTWNFSDNGFAGPGVGYAEFKNCWAFNGGQLDGEGCGFKLNLESYGDINNPLCRLLINCISAMNGNYGFSPNNQNGTVYNQHYYNNTAYHNGYKGYGNGYGWGFFILDYVGSTPAPNEMYCNNLAYNNEHREVYEGDNYFHEYNSWDNPANITITDADFVSLDWTEMLRPRKADGSLPDIDFLKLAEGSDLIDAGKDVGLPFYNSAPDLGYSEYLSSSGTPVYTNSVIENVTSAKLEIIYNITLANIVPPASAFTVTVNSVTRTVNSVEVSGTKVLLTLASPVSYGDIVKVAYAKPASNPIQNASGGQAASITAQNVTNNVGPVSPVYFSSVIYNATPTKLEIIYDVTLANIVPASSAFNVSVNSVIRAVNSVAVSGTKVQLTLASPVGYGDIVTVTYSKPSSNPIQTASGGQAASITAQNVINNVGPVSPVYLSSVIENATPSVLETIYDLTLVNIVPAVSAFSVSVNSVNRSVNSVAISGTKVLLTLASPVVYSDVVTITYNKPASNPLQTAAGGQAATFSSKTVTNKVSPPVPAYLSSVIENATPSRLEMTYSLSLANFVPAASAFTVSVNSVIRNINSIVISGTKVLLILSIPIVYGDVVTVAYTKPSSNPLQTTAGAQAASIITQNVTNNVEPVSPAYVNSLIENTSPAVMEITFSLTLAGIVPSTSAFTVSVNSVNRAVNSVAISGTKVSLTLASPVTYGDIVTVAYTKPAINPLQTAYSVQANPFSAANVTNLVGTVSPAYVSSVIENTSPAVLEITFSLALAGIVPSTSAFTVSVNSVNRAVNSVAISGTKVSLTLASPVVYGDVVTVAYTKPSTNQLQTASGGQVVSITAQSVTNNCSTPPNQSPVINIFSPGNNSSFISPATIIIEVNAYDPDGTLGKIEFFNGNIKLGENLSFSFPYTYSYIWKDVNEGTYTLTATATDNLNSTTVSGAVQVTVAANQIPIVSISSPINNTSVDAPAIITITANATDTDGSISKVEYFNGNIKIGEIYTPPYLFYFECHEAGTYELTATATDNLNAVGSSSSVILYATSDTENPDIINLFPNPNDGRFSIFLYSFLPEERNGITIVNSAGKIVYSGIITKEEYIRHFDLSYLTPDTYVLIITSGNKIITTNKFIINSSGI